MIFFIHIGKTAGSTVNSYLRDHLGPGHAHCEGFINGPLWRQRVGESAWMSGHVRLSQALRKMQEADRPATYFTCLREPKAQVISHYNWLIEIYHKGRGFYDAHPPHIRTISSKIRETAQDPTPRKIAEDLVRFRRLFLNHQSRYIVDAIHARSPRLLEMRLARFAAIGDSGSVRELVREIVGSDRVAEARSENKSRYHFDVGLFDSDEIAELLARENDYDNFLYAYVTSRMRGGVYVPEPGAGAEAAESHVP